MKKFSYYILNDDKTVTGTEDVRAWSEAFKGKKRVVGQVTTKEGHYVSTVFLGLDHALGKEELLLFETMIFSDDKDVDEYCERYSTWKQAKEGHKRIVAQLKAGTFVSGRKTLTLHLNKNKTDGGI